jgi:hypothetical protein
MAALAAPSDSDGDAHSRSASMDTTHAPSASQRGADQRGQTPSSDTGTERGGGGGGGATTTRHRRSHRTRSLTSASARALENTTSRFGAKMLSTQAEPGFNFASSATLGADPFKAAGGLTAAAGRIKPSQLRRYPRASGSTWQRNQPPIRSSSAAVP